MPQPPRRSDGNYTEIPGSPIHNYDSGAQPSGQTWNTEELQRDFDVQSFSAPFVVAIRKSDGVRGTLEFTHNPRVYFDFQPEAT